MLIYDLNGAVAATLSNNGTYNAFIVKFSANGYVVWAAQVAGDMDEFGTGVAIDRDGNIAIVG